MVEQFGKGLGATVDSVMRDLQHYRSLPPLQKNRFRAGIGAGLITFGIYALVLVGFSSGVACAVCAALIGFGALWFCIGVRNARSPVDVLSAFWWGVGVLFFAGMLVLGVYPAPEGGWSAVFHFLLQGIYVAGLVGSTVRIWLAVRGMDTAGLDAVKAQQAHGTARDATPAEAAAKLNEGAAPRTPRQFNS